MKIAGQQMHTLLCHGDWTCSERPHTTGPRDKITAHILRLHRDSMMGCVLPGCEEGFPSEDLLHSHEGTAHQFNGNLITSCLYLSILPFEDNVTTIDELFV
jgi:hypothetical protein